MANDTFRIHTFGCKVNTYDSGLLSTRLSRSGLDEDGGEPRVHILNTCAVTQEATKEAVRLIRKLKKRDPECTVVVTGCGAQVDTNVFENVPGADLVVANSHKGSLDELLQKHARGELSERVFKSNIFRKEDLEAGGGLERHHTRAFLKIQDGCNSFCTFCIIPYARGKSRSIPLEDLVLRVRELVHQGYCEVVLTGVHIGDYDDDGRTLEDLVEAICEKTTVERIRLSSLEPIELSERLLDLYHHPRMCAHFHMSIQSANTKVLGEMKRKYSHREVETALNEIARRLPHAFVGMDVIAGFTGESDDEFEDTFTRLQTLPWTRIHVFPYSEREGTWAARREDQVAQHVRADRARRLRELSSERYAQQALKTIGTELDVLLLRDVGSTMTGVARNYWPVVMSNDPSLMALRGREIRVRVHGFDPDASQSRLDAPLLAERIQ